MKPERFIALPDRAVISIAGADARGFLQGLITNDVERVSPTQAAYAALLTPQGKFLHDFFIAEIDGSLLLDCNSVRAADLVKRLTMYRLRAKVTISDETANWAVWALLPGGGVPGQASPRRGGVVFTDPRHARLGYRALMPAATDMTGSGLAQGNIAEYEKLRLTLGIPDGAVDMIPEKSLPLECGFDELNGVSFTKGCYVGQEVTTRMKHRALVKKRLFPVTVGAGVKPGAPVVSGAVEAGEIRSVVDGQAIALLRLDLADKGSLEAGGAPVVPTKPDWASF